MEKILVSACLLGEKTRYDGLDNQNEIILKLGQYYDLVPFCPEVEGGLKIPREVAEIRAGSVFTKSGLDVGKAYQRGAEKALGICKYLGIRIAILKDKSPSCGARNIYDGSFTHTLVNGLGVTARLLIANGIKVYAESDALDFLFPKAKEKYVAKQKDTNPRLNKEKPAKKSFSIKGTKTNSSFSKKERKKNSKHHSNDKSSNARKFKQNSFTKSDKKVNNYKRNKKNSG